MKFYIQERRILAFYKNRADGQFWDEHWKNNNFKNSISQIRWDPLFTPLSLKYLSKRAKILEGGCGWGLIVSALNKHGFQTTGIDFAKNTVEIINKEFPELDVIYGDIFDLPFEDESFDAYISGGVIEHFWEGYDQIINEMHRVLKPGGYCFVSFPTMSPIRKLKAKLGFYKRHSYNELNIKMDSFYQFALNHENVINDFTEYGFKYIEHDFMDGIKGMKDELLFTKPILQRVYDGKLLKKYRWFIDEKLRKSFGHMSLCVFIKL